MVSRPVSVRFDSWNNCGLHHSEFHIGTARILHRGKVSELLCEAVIEYELAAEGEDLGRLDAFDEMASAVVRTSYY